LDELTSRRLKRCQLRVAGCELDIWAGNAQLATRYWVVPPEQIDLDFMCKAELG